MEQASNDVLKYGKLAEEARANHDSVAAEAYDAKVREASDTATKWSDNGLYRVGLHAATQGMLGGLSNGGSGALESAAGVVGGNLGQRLGAQLGEAKADELGLTGEKRAALVNAYQNTGAVVGGMLAGAAAAGATGQTADAGALLAAAQGGEAAGTVDAFNRRLHTSEKWQIQQLAKDDPAKKARLLIASCALIKCSAEFAIGSPEYIEAKKIEDMGNSAVFKDERDLLSVQIGVRGKLLFTYDSESLLGSDADVDALKRWNNTYGVTTRTVGGLQVIGGYATGLASSGLIATGTAACLETLGLECAAALLGATGAVWSADQVRSGLITVGTGRATPTLGGKLVSNILGVSEGAGELINGVLGLSPMAVNAALAKGIIKIPVAASKVGATAGTVGASSTVKVGTIAYRPVSTSSSSILSSDGLAKAGQARADLYQAWKADNAAAYASIEEQAAGYRKLISGESPWPEGFTPANETIPQGARVRMALSPGQPLTSPGGFGTFDTIPNELYVRNELAVKYGWKSEISGVVEYEVTQPLPVRSGPVGPQIDLGANRYLPGGGSQVNLNVPRTRSRMDYLNVINFVPFP
jgi:hypothetical protein